MRISLDERYTKPEQRIAFFRRFMASAQKIPGVIKMGAADVIPLDHRESVSSFEIKGYGKARDMLDQRNVTPGYFGAIGLRLLSGRNFDEHDVKNNVVAIVNESFAKRFLKGNPLGRQIRSGVGDLNGTPWVTVIGVVADLRQTTLEEKPRPEVFRPDQAGLQGYAYLAIRAGSPSASIVTQLRRILHKMDPALSLEDVHTMRERIVSANAKRRFQTVLLTGFAGLAVLLACIGLYGVMAYAVKQRTAEIGIRMALGGSQGQVLSMVLRDGFRLVIAGLLLGALAAFALTRIMGGWLYGITATDPATFLGVLILMASIALCACLFPAVAATRVDPIASLRHE